MFSKVGTISVSSETTTWSLVSCTTLLQYNNLIRLSTNSFTKLVRVCVRIFHYQLSVYVSCTFLTKYFRALRTRNGPLNQSISRSPPWEMISRKGHERRQQKPPPASPSLLRNFKTLEFRQPCEQCLIKKWGKVRLIKRISVTNSPRVRLWECVVRNESWISVWYGGFLFFFGISF